jgi:hypothetical protein
MDVAVVVAYLPYLEGRHGRPRPETTRLPGNISVSASTRMARRGYADGDAEKREERRAHPQIRFRYSSVRQRTVRTASGGGTRARRAMPLPCPRGVGVQQPRNGKAAGLPSRRPFRLPGSLRCGVQGRPPAGSSHARASRTVPGRLRGYVGRRSVRPSDSTPRRR